jgi:hypothetical protein
MKQKKQLQIINLRDPLALIRCVLTGLSQAKGTTSLTFTQPLHRGNEALHRYNAVLYR